MLFSARDIDILKLLRWCRFIREDALTETFSEIEITNLQALSLIKLHRSSGAYLLTAKGNRLLDEAIPGLPTATPPAYKAADTIRRLHLSEIMLTAYSSGLDPFALHTNTLLENLTFFLPAISRGRGTNPWAVPVWLPLLIWAIYSAPSIMFARRLADWPSMMNWHCRCRSDPPSGRTPGGRADGSCCCPRHR